MKVAECELKTQKENAMVILERARSVGKIIGRWALAIIMVVIAAMGVGTYKVIEDNMRLRQENEVLIDKNARLQVKNWTLDTAASFCSPVADSVHIVKE